MKKIQRISHLLQQSDAENVAHLNGDVANLSLLRVCWEPREGKDKKERKGTQERQKHARMPGSEVKRRTGSAMGSAYWTSQLKDREKAVDNQPASLPESEPDNPRASWSDYVPYTHLQCRPKTALVNKHTNRQTNGWLGLFTDFRIVCCWAVERGR